MSGFDADWLDLRESADARARNGDLLKRLLAGIDSGDTGATLSIYDLGGGTGANLRVLAPALGGDQHWQIIDNDAALLAAQPQRIAAWARASGHQCRTRRGPGTPSADPQWPAAATAARRGAAAAGAKRRQTGPCSVLCTGFAATIEPRCLDLATALVTLDFGPRSLVTASALLDLVSDAWLAAAVGTIAGARAAGYFVLSYDGRISLTPADPLDEQVRALVNEHQRIDKGFGPSLGPAASAAAAAHFRAAGYLTETAASDWQLDARDAALERTLVEGWIDAALEVEPGARERLEPWLSMRSKQIAGGTLRISVGHEDLLALPAG